MPLFSSPIRVLIDVSEGGKRSRVNPYLSSKLGNIFSGSSIDITTTTVTTEKESAAAAAATTTIATESNSNDSISSISPNNDEEEWFYRYIGNEDVRGDVLIKLEDPSKGFDHTGIKIEFVGEIVLSADKGTKHNFALLQYDLMPTGRISEGVVVLPFEFPAAPKQYDSYIGANVRLRYLLRVTIGRSFFSSNIVREQEIWVVNYYKPPVENPPIRMEVGVEDCLHVEFEYNKSKYHLKDIVIGKVTFLLVRLRIQYMQACLIRRESSGLRKKIIIIIIIIYQQK